LAHGIYSTAKRKLVIKEYILQNEKITMIIIPFYYCRNCRKLYPGNKLEIANTPIEKFVSAACYTLGSQEHISLLAYQILLNRNIYSNFQSHLSYY
jgi:hypothetical protein